MPLDQTTGNAYVPPKKKKPSADIEQLRASSGETVGSPQETARLPYQSNDITGIFPVGDIHAVNKQVETITLAYQNRFGQLPSPGLVYDLLRAPVSPHEYNDLFRAVPRTTSVARNTPPGVAMGVQRAEALPVGPDLVRQQIEKAAQRDYTNIEANRAQRSPESGYTRNDIESIRARQSPAKPDAFAIGESQRTHPTVQVGILPVSNQGVYDAMGTMTDYLDRFVGEGKIQVSSQGVDLVQFQAMVKEADGLGGLRQVGAAITTIEGAQEELNKEMGTNLPVTGVMNDDWLKALSSWMKTPDYFQKTATFQAESAGFGDNYPKYLEAWKNKQDAVKNNGWAEHFLNLLPINLYADGTSPLEMLRATGTYLRPHPLSGHVYTPLTRSAGLALRVSAGVVQEGKAYLQAEEAASNAQARNATAKMLHEAYKNGQMEEDYTGTYEDAHQVFVDAFHKNPSWLRIIDPNVSDETADSTLGQAVNLLGDLVLLRKPSFTGEALAGGNISRAAQSSYLKSTTKFAYNYLSKGKRYDRAASMLEGGQGAEQLVAAAASPIRKGQMSAEMFRSHAAELYATGHTTIKVGERSVDVSGPLLSSLRTESLPSAGVAGREWIRAKNGLRATTDNFDSWARSSPLVPDLAPNFTSWIRARFQHDARGTRGFYDPRLPERIHDWALNTFKDAAFANKAADDFVRARAFDNVPRMQAVERRMIERYIKEHPGSEISSADLPFEGPLLTESASKFRMVGGGETEIDNYLTATHQGAKRLNAWLNKAAQFHSRIILSGAPVPGGGLSLAWKHIVGDTLRRFAGGGFSAASKNRSVSRKIESVLRSDSGLERQYSTFLSRARDSETRYILGRTQLLPKQTFKTSERFGQSNYMATAGAFLRRRVTDPALEAYLKTSGGTDLKPLTEFILKDRQYRSLFNHAMGEEIKIIRSTARSKPEFQSRLYGLAQEYSQLVALSFRDIEEAGRAAGVANPLRSAQEVFRGNRGAKADKALGKWVEKNKIDFSVNDGLVQRVGRFDDWTQRWIGVIMTGNKLNREGMAKSVLADQFSALSKAGFDEKTAMSTAMDVAEKQTVYHMLDFANRLQVEQDLRWLSYFATKHRLYWKWVLGTALHRPNISAAINDIREGLNDRGEFGFEIGGHSFTVPAARLVWVPGREYSEFSPLALAVAGTVTSQDPLKYASGTFGNVLTRSDTALQLGGRMILMKLGKFPSTYDGATRGLDDHTASRLNFLFNSYQNEYFAEHGRYAPEADVVKSVLWKAAAEEMWRANLPLPVYGGVEALTGTAKADEAKKAIQPLLKQYGDIRDPRKKRKFLEQHPDVATVFGVYQDPKIRTHVNYYWSEFNKANDAKEAERQRLYAEAKKTGYTAEIRDESRKVNDTFYKRLDELKRQAARAWYGSGAVSSDGEVLQQDPWNVQLSSDPQADPRGSLEKIFPNLTKGELAQKIPGQIEKNLKDERTFLSGLLRQGETAIHRAGYEDESAIKERLGQISERLQPFDSFPHDALGKIQRAYQTKYVNPYWDTYDKKYNHIHSDIPTSEQATAFAIYREWKNKQDHPVTINGVKFPSPQRMAWGGLDPQTRQERLARIANGDWEHLSDYEKELLGKKTNSDVGQGWLIYRAALDAAAGNILPEDVGKTKVTWYNNGKKETTPLADILPKSLPATGSRYLAANQKIAIARGIDKFYANGFYKDYLFSLQPKYQRLQTLPYINKGKYSSEWKQVFSTADKMQRVINQIRDEKRSDYTITAMKNVWKDYVRTKLIPWIQKEKPVGFQTELDNFGPDLLYTLIQ